MTESEILDTIHDVIVTRNRYEEYAKRTMRDATEEELKSVNDYVKSISEETGVEFGDFYDSKIITSNWIYI